MRNITRIYDKARRYTHQFLPLGFSVFLTAIQQRKKDGDYN